MDTISTTHTQAHTMYLDDVYCDTTAFPEMSTVVGIFIASISMIYICLVVNRKKK